MRVYPRKLKILTIKNVYSSGEEIPQRRQELALLQRALPLQSIRAGGRGGGNSFVKCMALSSDVTPEHLTNGTSRIAVRGCHQ